jgi:hypothetical protein
VSDRAQCPFCLAHVQLRGDGAMRAHDKTSRLVKTRCRGSGKTKEQALEAKAGVRAPSPVQPW